MTIRHALDEAQAKLASAGINSARLDAELLMAQVITKERPWILAHADETLSGPDQADYAKLVAKRAQRIPLVHLTNACEFYGLDLEITPDVLTPRVETEQMVDWALQYAAPDSRLIDIGCGSGAIAIAIAKARPDLAVWASEISPAAMTVARRNADKHGLNIKFVQSDLFEAIAGQFSTVVTNLPYLQTQADLSAEVKYEPAVALFGGPDGLELYRRFFHQLPVHLAAAGRVLTECDPWQQDQLIAEAATAGLAPLQRGYFITAFG